MKKVKAKSSLSSEQKAKERVLIAKDVIKTINSGYLRPAHFVYLEMETDKSVPTLDGGKFSVKKALDQAKYCDVCAKGAIFASYVKKHNECYIGEGYEGKTVGSYDQAEELKWCGSDFIVKSVRSLFTKNQMDLIEMYFEGSPQSTNKILISHFSKARAFYSSYENAEQRMIAIMKNIIENKGTFKPVVPTLNSQLKKD